MFQLRIEEAENGYIVYESSPEYGSALKGKAYVATSEASLGDLVKRLASDYKWENKVEPTNGL